MGYARLLGAAAAATALLAATPLAAQSEVEASTQLRRLDMMLMVTSLRCRFGPDNFQASYDSFRSRHSAALRVAAEQVLGDMTRRMGRKGAIAQFDRMSTGMANAYGNGHPYLDCAELKAVAGELARIEGRTALVAAAADLLDSRVPAIKLAQR